MLTVGCKSVSPLAQCPLILNQLLQQNFHWRPQHPLLWYKPHNQAMKKKANFSKKVRKAFFSTQKRLRQRIATTRVFIAANLFLCLSEYNFQLFKVLQKEHVTLIYAVPLKGQEQTYTPMIYIQIKGDLGMQISLT